VENVLLLGIFSCCYSRNSSMWVIILGHVLSWGYNGVHCIPLVLIVYFEIFFKTTQLWMDNWEETRVCRHKSMLQLLECTSVPTCNYRAMGTKEVLNASLPYMSLDNGCCCLYLLFLASPHHFPLALSNRIVEAVGISRNNV
jgi:hypothetical protein